MKDLINKIIVLISMIVLLTCITIPSFAYVKEIDYLYEEVDDTNEIENNIEKLEMQNRFIEITYIIISLVICCYLIKKNYTKKEKIVLFYLIIILFSYLTHNILKIYILPIIEVKTVNKIELYVIYIFLIVCINLVQLFIFKILKFKNNVLIISSVFCVLIIILFNSKLEQKRYYIKESDWPLVYSSYNIYNQRNIGKKIIEIDEEGITIEYSLVYYEMIIDKSNDNFFFRDYEYEKKTKKVTQKLLFNTWYIIDYLREPYTMYDGGVLDYIMIKK